MVSEEVGIDIHGNRTVSTTILDPVAKRSMTTVDIPEAANNRISIREYGLAVSRTSASGLTTTYDYDALGRRISQTDPRTGTSIIHYDANGRIDYREDAAGNRTEFGYDPATGRKIWEKNALGNYSRYSYNDRGQLTHTWGDTTYPVRYEYDDYGRRTQMYTYRDGSNWNGASWPENPGTADVTTWHYDPATGLLTAKEDAAGKKVTYTYQTGRLATRTWARTDNGVPLSTTYSYDPATAELREIDYSDATTDISFSYDRLGRRETITDAAGSRTFSYTDSLQLGSETINGLYNKTITRDYTQSGRPAGFSVDAEYSASYGYDSATGRFTSVSWDADGSTGSADYGYLPNSDLLESVTYSSGGLTTYGYEPHRNLKTRVRNEFNTNLISQYDYSYDALGRRENVRNSGSAFAQNAFTIYGYNDRNELTSADCYLGSDVNDTSQPVESEKRGYSYDNIGNRKQATDWDEAASVQMQLTYTANQLNQYDLITADNQADKTPSYDDDGNMIDYDDKVYTYNAENRLTAIEPELPTEGDNRLEFVYDYMGRRVSKKVYTYSAGSWVENSTVLFLYDGWNMIAELDEAGEPVASYVWGLDLSQSLQGAGGVGGLLARVDNGASKTHHYFYDANGNVGQLVDSADGALGAAYEYDPFGDMVSRMGEYAEVNPFRFSTKYFDGETGLYYYGYRFYMPELGRWINRDPIGEQGGLNLYSFVLNSPLNSYDKFGLDVCSTVCGDKCTKGEEGLVKILSEHVRIIPYKYSSPEQYKAFYDTIDDLYFMKTMWDASQNYKAGGFPKVVGEEIAGKFRISTKDVNKIALQLMDISSGNFGGWKLFTLIKYKKCEEEKCCFDMCKRLNWCEKKDGWRKFTSGKVLYDDIYETYQDAIDSGIGCYEEHKREVLSGAK